MVKKSFNSMVSVYHNPELIYPTNEPYNPSVQYPEYFMDISLKKNNVYDAVRNSFFLLGLDKNNYETPDWNPLKDIIGQGNTVVIKPNFVIDNHNKGGDLFSIITHPSVIRAVIDYVYIALAREGRIIITDAPQMDCDFNNLLEKTKMESIKELYRNKFNFNIEVYDLRDFWLNRKSNTRGSGTESRVKLSGDQSGSIIVNLSKESLFYEVDDYKKFYGADYNRNETIKHHHKNIQEYQISKTILSANTIISIPKLKVHEKAGVTLNMKGLVGINTNKNYLIHYKLGSPRERGDQFPDNFYGLKEKMKIKLQRMAFDIFLSKKNKLGDFVYEFIRKLGKFCFFKTSPELSKDRFVLDSGNWYGNDSVWRMVIDLLRIFLYTDKSGKLHDVPIRKSFSIVDGVIGGEKNGPLTPEAKNCGLIVSGFDLACVDLVCTRLMGFDYKKIKMFNYLINDHPELFKVNLNKIKVMSNKKFGNIFDKNNKNKYFDFEPHSGWKNFIEI